LDIFVEDVALVQVVKVEKGVVEFVLNPIHIFEMRP
jgi:hypothetical protein